MHKQRAAIGTLTDVSSCLWNIHNTPNRVYRGLEAHLLCLNLSYGSDVIYLVRLSGAICAGV